MKQKNNFLGKLKRYRVLLLMLLPAVLYVILFNYIPMAGIVLAFKKYNYVDGIFGSPWNGVDNFRFFFKSGQAWKVTRNTFLLITYKRPLRLTILHSGVRFFNDALTFISFYSFICI